MLELREETQDVREKEQEAQDVPGTQEDRMRRRYGRRRMMFPQSHYGAISSCIRCVYLGCKNMSS